MVYFAIRNESGKVISFGTTTAENTPYEITEAEYLVLKQESETFNAYINAVYSGELPIEDVPEEYRADVDARVSEMKEADSNPEPEEPMTDIDEALAILHGEVTE